MDSKIILITGANNGIGLAMTQILLADGYLVAALDLTTENLESLRSAYPNQLSASTCDVSDVNQVRAAVEAVIQKWERIDIVVNNAALAIFKRFEERTMDETRREFDVNYFGYVNVIAAVLPHMKTRGGIIHNMSSGVGVTGFPRLSGYASTKGAIESLTRTLVIEFAPYGIRVNLMHPPLTNTTSASPLGVPLQALADPAIVGRNLAKQIESAKPVIASDLRTSVFLFLAYRYPLFFGRLFSRLGEGRAMGLMKFSASVLQAVLPSPPVTVEQLRLLEQDNICAADAVEKAFGFVPTRYREPLQEFIS